MEVPTLSFTVRNMKPQKFRIPNPLLNYIRETASGRIMSKLFRSCKYFYHRKPYCIVEELTIRDENVLGFCIGDEIILVNENQLKLFDNILISKGIRFSCCYPEEFLDKIARCDGEATFSNSCFHRIPTRIHKRFPLNDYKFLMNSVTYWDSYFNTVISDDGKLVPVDELLDHLPSATQIQ